MAKQTKTVVLRHMFTLEELASDPTLLLELKEDVREECETLGKVTNVVLYDVSSRISISIGRADPRVAFTARTRWHHDSPLCRRSSSESMHSGALTLLLIGIS